MKTIRVVAAVIRDEDRIFATQRGYGEFKGQWELPGGKIEEGETSKEALVREIREELDTEIEVGDLIDTVEYDYPSFHLSMDCFWAHVNSGKLFLKEAQAARWLAKNELYDVEWLPADFALVGLIEKKMESFMVREANERDLKEILELYLFLHETSVPEETEHLKKTWDNIVRDENHHLIICEVNGKIVSSCVCVIIHNLTRNVRPYAFIENVVTHGDYRKKGYATACLNYAKQIAVENHCYKMMLLTGSKEESTLNFYRNAGYNSSDKTAFIQWIDME